MEPKLLEDAPHYAQYLSLNRFFRSSRIESLTPLPFGSDTWRSSSLPTMKMFESRVANWWFDASRTATMSKLPGCFSTLTIVPTRPVLRPFVIMHVMPTSNLIESTILPDSKSTLTTVDLDGRRRVADRAAVVRREDRDLLGRDVDGLDPAQLVRLLRVRDPM